MTEGKAKGNKLVGNVSFIMHRLQLLKGKKGESRRASSGRPIPSAYQRHCNWLYGRSISLDFPAMSDIEK